MGGGGFQGVFICGGPLNVLMLRSCEMSVKTKDRK